MKYLAGSPDADHFIDTLPVLELTRRNLVSLLEKLDDPLSSRTLIDGTYTIRVRAVEDGVHYNEGRLPGVVYMPSTGEYK